MNALVGGQSSFRCLSSLTLIGCLAFQTGCATVLQGRTQTIHVTSDPPGAEILVDGKQVSSTPADVSVKRRSAVTIRLEKEGYAPFELKMKRGLSRWMLADLAWASWWYLTYTGLLGNRAGLLGAAIYGGPPFLVDFLTGSAFTRNPSEIRVKLFVPGEKETQ